MIKGKIKSKKWWWLKEKIKQSLLFCDDNKFFFDDNSNKKKSVTCYMSNNLVKCVTMKFNRSLNTKESRNSTKMKLSSKYESFDIEATAAVDSTWKFYFL